MAFPWFFESISVKGNPFAPQNFQYFSGLAVILLQKGVFA